MDMLVLSLTRPSHVIGAGPAAKVVLLQASEPITARFAMIRVRLYFFILIDSAKKGIKGL